jgi:hypothetical protein
MSNCCQRTSNLTKSSGNCQQMEPADQQHGAPPECPKFRLASTRSHSHDGLLPTLGHLHASGPLHVLLVLSDPHRMVELSRHPSFPHLLHCPLQSLVRPPGLPVLASNWHHICCGATFAQLPAASGGLVSAVLSNSRRHSPVAESSDSCQQGQYRRSVFTDTTLTCKQSVQTAGASSWAVPCTR